MSSMGTKTVEQVGTLALNFVPGVGPFLAAGASLLEGIFGGSGDPTPEWKLSGEVLQLRQQLATIHQQIGVADDWKLAGAIGSGDNTPELQSAVTFALGHPGSGPTWRSDLYTSIANLQKMVTAAAQDSHDQTLISQVVAAIAAQNATITPPTTGATAASGSPGSATGADSAQTVPAAANLPPGASPTASQTILDLQPYAPWIFGSFALILAVSVLAHGSDRR